MSSGLFDDPKQLIRERSKDVQQLIKEYRAQGEDELADALERARQAAEESS